MLNMLLFKIFPYIAVTIFIGVGIYRYRGDRFTYSSMSSEFFEKKSLFFGSVPWHYGIIIVLLWHIFAFLFPSVILSMISDYSRLFFFESVALGAGLLALAGIVIISFRRISVDSVRVNSTTADWLLLIILIFQVISGIIISVSHRWGISWFASNISPYLWSLVTFSPEASYIEGFPAIVKFHFFNAFLLVAVIPFTKLVHLLSIPVSFPLRQNIIVKWNR